MSVKSELRNFVIRSIRFVFKGIPVYKVYPQVVTLPPNKLLEGRCALVTGGTSGIGFEITKAFLQAGASVVITGRDMERIKKTCIKIEKETGVIGRLYGIEMDNKKVEDFEKNVEKCVSLLGKIDILVNNAGIHGGHVSTATVDEYDSIMDTNLRGVFFLTQKIARYMKDNSIRGNILNIASSSSLRPADSAYCLSKWGIRGFTIGMARIMAPYDIVVNGLAPGPTATPMLMRNGIKQDLFLPKNLMKRYALPVEIANMAVILVSNMGRMVVGDVVYMTGGGGNVTNEDVEFWF